MNFNFRQNAPLLVGAAALALSASLMAASTTEKGSKPKGKPFVAIDNQIVEVQGSISSLQDQLDVLVADVDTLEGRVTANELAIQNLQDENDLLAALISQNATDVTTINAVIADLQAQNVDLQAQILSNSGDISVLEAEVAYNEGVIQSLQSALAMANSNLIALGTDVTDLAGQVANNDSLILLLQNEIQAIQDGIAFTNNLLDSQCPGDSHLVAIQSDGSIVCDPDDQGATGLSMREVYSARYLVPGNGNARTTNVAPCPSGYQITGGGHVARAPFIVPYESKKVGNGWRVAVKNIEPFTIEVFSIAYCIKLLP